MSIDHAFNWNWRLTDLADVSQNGLKVFSCFSCGGGSTMGYKLAGYSVIGNCDIDKDMMSLYIYNNRPKRSYNMDIREFAKLENLPDELFDLDILDGSPPCSTFSMAGNREKDWNTEKQFREGQKMQRLDDLFFEYIALAKRLRPKVIVAENVRGLITGNAKGYVNEILKAFKAAGYDVQMFLLNAATMGVPQSRERVFFIARRSDLSLPDLVLSFNEKPILFGEIRTPYGIPLKTTSKYKYLLRVRKETDKRIADIYERVYGRKSGYNNTIESDRRICQTIVSSGLHFRMFDGMRLSDRDYMNAQTFPQDYDFRGQSAQYVCGMSVPPVMMASISRQIENQWFKKA